MLRDIASSIHWIASGILHPLMAIHDIRHFFHEMGTSLKALARMIRENPEKGLANFFGGFLYYVSHHSVEFVAQTTLLLACGFAVIPPMSEAVESVILKTFSVSAGNAGALGAVRVSHC